MTPTIYTFGYAGKTLADLETVARERNALVIDVRFAPFSRSSPEWAKSTLAVRLPRYAWLKAFGNENYRGGPIRIMDYLAGLSQMQARLWADESPLLLCVCSKVETCHRSQLANRLHADLGWPIEHLGVPRPKARQGGLFT